MAQRTKFDFITTPSEIWGYPCGVAEDTNLLGCDAVSFGGWFQTFESIRCLHVQGSSSPRKLDPKDKDATILHNVSNFSPSGTSHPRRLVPSSQYQLHPRSTLDHVVKIITLQMYTKHFSTDNGFHDKSGRYLIRNMLQNIISGTTTLDKMKTWYSWTGPQLD